ncbi:MAG TPA: flagellar motor switch protein FliN [Gammaproteobacteria bacterium]|jgi:flagellar motor switch protein FliN/FliY|nr:flagellar motor switch protein FliN [Gammaproteobacteria bacterium]
MNDTTVATDMTDPNNSSDANGALQETLADTAPQGADSQNLELVMDIPVTLSMELGRTRMSIQELLQLNSGSVVELQRMADEPMDVLVNGTLVAHGEAVVIGDKFGVRLTDVVSAKERVKRIR